MSDPIADLRRAERNWAKRRSLAYRAAASHAVAAGTAKVTIPLTADVAPCEGGAFVDAVVWVPAAALDLLQ